MRMKSEGKDGGAWVPEGIVESSYQLWNGDLWTSFTPIINTNVNLDNVIAPVPVSYCDSNYNLIINKKGEALFS